MVVELDLKGLLGIGADGVFIGFTASTAGVGETQEVLSWNYRYCKRLLLPSSKFVSYSPCCTQVGSTYASNCEAFGSGKEASVAGEAAYFTIQAVDQFGYNITTGGELFAVTITATSAVPGKTSL